MNDPTFSIVVPTHRRPETLRETLTALLGLDYPVDLYQVIVVSDGADDATARIVEQLCGPEIPLRLESQPHRGAASARNRGAQLAAGEMVLFCDDDMLAAPAHLRDHLAAHQRHPRALVGGTWELASTTVAALRATPFGRYRMALERRFAETAGGERLDNDPSCLQVPLLSAANLSMKRALFWSIGGFDENFPFGAEDQDLSVRARSHGAQLLLDNRIRCVHNDSYLTLAAYCARSERNARGLAVLARKHPAVFGDLPYARENRPIQATDPLRLIGKKLIKAALASRPALGALHRSTVACEAASAPERVLRRLYTVLLGLHLFRGFRDARPGCHAGVSSSGP